MKHEMSGLRSCGLPYLHLCGKREGIYQEKTSELFELLDFRGSEFFVVMHALIAVEADQVCPFLEVCSELSIFREKIYALCQRLVRHSRVQLAGSCFKSLAEHGCRGVMVSSLSIIQPLKEGLFNRGRNATRCFELLSLRVLLLDRRAHAICEFVEVPKGKAHYPVAVSRSVEEADAEHLPAPVACESHGTGDFACGNHPNRSHCYVCGIAMRTISDKIYGHIHSIGARMWAVWGQA